MDTPTATCRTCALFAQRAHDRMAAVSEFGNCAHLPPWHYLAPQRACRFDPPKWERKREAA